MIDTQQVSLHVKSKENPEFSFHLHPYVKTNLNVGSDRIDIPLLKERFPHLEPLKSIVYSYSDVRIILGQDAFRAIRPIEYFESEHLNGPVAVRLPIGWVLSGPLPSSSSFVSTCFKANIDDTALADQLRSWYEIESYGTYVQADTRSKADRRALQILKS